MADEVTRQVEGVRTLHLRNLRKTWQILALQVIATVALVRVYLEVIDTYIIGHLDHTLVLNQLDLYIKSGTNDNYEIPLADWMTGLGSDGMSRVYMPIALGLILG